jgi:hypothetical protein
MRRAEIGHHHHIAGLYLLRYAQRGVMAGGMPAALQWRTAEPRGGTGDGVEAERRFRGPLARALSLKAIIFGIAFLVAQIGGSSN